jgi:endogenous inhibitor of DNA gyrase (YacG/DUF329 family)
MTAETPRRNDDRTLTCPICGAAVPAAGRQRFCSARCRQTAWRRRHPPAIASIIPPPGRSRRALTVYECPACALRLLGHQRCPDCHLWARRLGLGGLCPACDEPVTLADLGLDPITHQTEVPH